MRNSQAAVLLLLLVTFVPTKAGVIEDVLSIFPDWMKMPFKVAKTCYEYKDYVELLRELHENREEYIRCSTKVFEEDKCHKMYTRLFGKVLKSKLFSMLGKLGVFPFSLNVPVKLLKNCYMHVDDLEMLKRELAANSEGYLTCSTKIFEDEECYKMFSQLFGIILKSDGLLVCLAKETLL
ncbi:hypothetical protein AMEX_G15091 [Astyanax mexicanus]|uniref:Uncharacterized protein n=1 Tax=Astyanax mexicanus TaxID=7994 RepID=A0A8T2LMV2_ASTMX|nr:hypothetical protein AMEX_G15091 [Astyanax mexicanus]